MSERFERIGKIETPLFSALLSTNEFLQVFRGSVSIIDPSTQLCKFFFILPAVPRYFSISASNSDRFALVYGATDGDCETLVILDSHTGKIRKKIVLKPQYPRFLHVSLGTHLTFILENAPTNIFITPPVGGSIKQIDLHSNVKFMQANPEEEQVLVVKADKHLQVFSTANDLKQIYDIQFNRYTFLKFTKSYVIYGTTTGDVAIIDLSNGQSTSIKSPHHTRVVSYSEKYAVTYDGLLYNTETNAVIENCFSPISINVRGNTVSIVCKNETVFYQIVQHPICTNYQFQPPEPFVSDEYMMEPNLLFTSGSTLYSYDLSSASISKFTSVQISPKKIINCSAMVSLLYSTPEGDKIMTFVTGAMKRDEFGIDITNDRLNHTWILQSDSLICIARELLSFVEIYRITLPNDHQFDQVFRIGSTIGIYSTQYGSAAYISNNSLIGFILPQNIKIICWPALCTSDRLFICQNDDGNYENLEPPDYVVLENCEISSCCWLAYTLFAVEKRIVYAIGINGRKRPLESLPNNLCTIMNALPSQLTFVTSIPEIHVVKLKRPNLFEVLADVPPSCSQYIPYIIGFLPHNLGIDPRTIYGTPPLLMMTIFARDPPKFLTNEVIDCYSRFARFAELRNMAYQYKQKDKLRYIANSCRKIGLFHIAQQIYEELGDEESLLELFLICCNRHNIAILAKRTEYGECIKQELDIDPEDGEYEPLINYPLPKLKSLINGQEFSLKAGNLEYSTPIYPSNFDDLSDFGRLEFQLTRQGEEDEQTQVQSQQFSSAGIEGMLSPPAPSDAPADTEPIVVMEAPKVNRTMIEGNEIENDPFKDDEEEVAPMALNFQIDLSAGRKRRGGGAPIVPKLNMSLDSPVSPNLPARRRRITSPKRSLSNLEDHVPDSPVISSADESMNNEIRSIASNGFDSHARPSLFASTGAETNQKRSFDVSNFASDNSGRLQITSPVDFTSENSESNSNVAAEFSSNMFL